MCNLADLSTPYSDSTHPCLGNLPKQTDRFGGSGPLRLPVQSSDHYKKHHHLKKETVGFENLYVFPLIPAHTHFANIRFLIINYNYFVNIFIHYCKKQTLILVKIQSYHVKDRMGNTPHLSQKIKEVKPIGEKFTLFIGDTDKKTFEQFARRYPNPHTSSVILGLIRNHLHGDIS